MIVESIHEIIQADPSTPVLTIIAHMKSSLEYTVTYKKAWLGKQLAIENVYDNWEESYKKWSALLNVMQLYVPRFIQKIKTQPIYEGNQLDADHIIFNMVFWTFKSCINGFKFCKSVVQVDGTFLYGVAVAQDDRKKLSMSFFGKFKTLYNFWYN